MLGKRQSTPQPDDVPEVAVSQRRGISIVWLIPLVAGAIAIWLAYTTLREQGPTITITFKTAAGLEAGKTKVTYKDVAIGLVDAVHLSPDGRRVVVTANMDKTAAPQLRERTQFWVVRPRIGASGVSGLGTLVSGAFIEMDPGTGDERTEFTGLEVPPLVRTDEAGRRFVLLAKDRGSVSRGSAIYFRGIEVGQVLGEELAADNRSVRIDVFVRAPHDQLVQKTSRFWNASGIHLSMSADGVRVSTESLESILTGGIAFDTPIGGKPEAADEGTTFPLYQSFESVTEASYAAGGGIAYLVNFDGSVRGLRAGAPVEFRGMKIGTVRDVRMEFDATDQKIRIPVVFEIQPDRITIIGRDKAKPYEFMARLVQRGLRAQLKSGNLLTGELLVDLDFHPDAPTAELLRDGTYPEIPSVPSQLDVLTTSISGTLRKIAALPLDGLVDDLRRTVQSIDALVASADTKAAVGSLNASAQDLGKLLQTLDQQTGPALVQARSTLATAEGLIAADSQLRYDLNAMLRELTSAARSIRVFADYLERHPDALLRGKSGP